MPFLLNPCQYIASHFVVLSFPQSITQRSHFLPRGKVARIFPLVASSDNRDTTTGESNEEANGSRVSEGIRSRREVEVLKANRCSQN